MNNKYIFYFDEIYHDRNITNKSIADDNFYNSYISVGLGISKLNKEKGLRRLRLLDSKYKVVFSVQELKSHVVKRKKYKNGLASFGDNDLNLYLEFFDILYNYNFIYYISSCNKVEYILNQCTYNGYGYLNGIAIIYAIAKAINIYKPAGVIQSLFNENDQFLNNLKSFLIEQIQINGSIALKEKENIAFSQALVFLENIDVKKVKYEFSYDFTYIGLKHLLSELEIDIHDVKPIIDEEGTGKILQTAKKNGFTNSIQMDSKGSVGVRAADLINGFIGRLMEGIYLSTYYEPGTLYSEKHDIPLEWFKVNEKQFKLYKTVAKYLKKYSFLHYSTYISIYSDLFISIIGLIYYFDEYMNFDEYNKVKIENHKEKCNGGIVSMTYEHLKDIESMGFENAV